MSDPHVLVIGTAGHIDHGKSRLVHALTGTNPDRLPEEQARGLTIDLGFAHARWDDARISFVDVPGHERFIRNMVAGATGVDLAILVVAADDSVMPQTREHAEVLALLGIDRCVLVLTKMDLVDDEWGDAVEDEARELLGQLQIAPIACVRTSAEDGRGIDELRTCLIDVARTPQRPQLPYTWFRMPVDRSFTVPGRGTIVTGSVAHGAVHREDTLTLWPEQREVRVRDLQSHHDAFSQATGRMRLALNLATIRTDEVGRGHELATPGYLAPAQYFDVWLASFRMPGKTIRKTHRLRLHIATRDVLAELRLLESPAEAHCRGTFAQLRVASPIVAAWGQSFILRDEAATRTLGGGRMLRVRTRRWSTRHPVHVEGLKALRDHAEKDRIEEVVRHEEWCDARDGELSAAAGLADADAARRVVRSLLDRNRLVAFEVAGRRVLVHTTRISSLTDMLNQRLRHYLEAHPRAPGVPRSEWPGWMPKACPARHRPLLAEWLIAENHVALASDCVVSLGHAGALASDDQELLDTILGEFAQAAFQPPDPRALACITAKNRKQVADLVQLAAKRGQLVRIADGIWLHARRWDELVRIVTKAIRERGPVTVADIRTLLDSSRKYVVPIVERLDAAGITKRSGDRRNLGPQAPAPAES